MTAVKWRQLFSELSIYPSLSDVGVPIDKLMAPDEPVLPLVEADFDKNPNASMPQCHPCHPCRIGSRKIPTLQSNWTAKVNEVPLLCQ
jgi:hypothetical protein